MAHVPFASGCERRSRGLRSCIRMFRNPYWFGHSVILFGGAMNKTEKIILSRTGIAGLLGAAMLGAGSANASAIVYSGRATVANVTATLVLLNPKVVIGDTGELDPSGATRDATSAAVTVPAPIVVQTGTLSAYTSGTGKVSASSAAVQKVHLNVAGLLQVDADAVDAASSAQCTAGKTSSLHGSSSVARLTINGILINAAVQPNV